MPFLGQDWRSPGEQWVRTTEGWERLGMWRLKLLENLNENVIARFLKLMEAEFGWEWDGEVEMEDCHCPQPHIYLKKGTTKEQKIQTTIGESFGRLDISGAVKDIGRFNYVCTLTELLIRYKLSSLSGTAQKYLFNVLDEILNQVARTHNNGKTMQQLLAYARTSLEEGQYNHVGSSSLWDRHYETVERMQATLNSLQIKEREEDGRLMLSELPEDCIRLILARLTDHRDIVNTGMTESRTFSLTQEQVLWKTLCLYHFDNHQMATVFRRGEDWNLGNLTTEQWQTLYLRLVKRYGMKPSYAEMIHLCRHCNALFWERHGHPCLISNMPPKSVPVSPAMCVELFTA